MENGSASRCGSLDFNGLQATLSKRIRESKKRPNGRLEEMSSSALSRGLSFFDLAH
jgi:hypothetical protein